MTRANHLGAVMLPVAAALIALAWILSQGALSLACVIAGCLTAFVAAFLLLRR